MYQSHHKHIHFVGIGGIGMSGIAAVLRSQGYIISGCDLDIHQKGILNLKEMGCSIYEGNNTSACYDPSIDILVYSTNVPLSSPEIIAAAARGIPTIQRATMLAELLRTAKCSIAVAGAHGKTTTTSMIAHILLEAQLDPTIIVGGHLKNLSTNARFGKGNILVAEADESDRSFLKLHPTLAIITNIDFEHVDVYADLHDIQEAFSQFLHNIPFYGAAFVCIDNEHVRSLLPLPDVKIIRYGCSEDADICARDSIIKTRYSSFTIWKRHEQLPLGTIFLTVPGHHNLLNATAAVAVSLELGIPFSTISRALASFSGVDRRFTYRGSYKGAELFDDYGHHPTEIDVTLRVARARAEKRLIVAFQPHRYTRTQGLWDQFLAVFQTHAIDHLIITDIYSAGEQPIKGITSPEFVKNLSTNYPVSYQPAQPQWESVAREIKHLNPQPGDLILCLGAGKINKVLEYLAAEETFNT
jgi:UDP-N-acetylmuramate--alanine ligase